MTEDEEQGLNGEEGVNRREVEAQLNNFSLFLPSETFEPVQLTVRTVQGIHIECGKLNFERPRWKCDICR